MSKVIFTSESVGSGHPDKICDIVSDTILDAYLKEDPKSKVAIETLVTTDHMTIAGEVKSKVDLDIRTVASEVIDSIGYSKHLNLGFDSDCNKDIRVHEQSPDINQGVEKANGLQGAGDQGIMFGGAVNETPELMPLPIALSKAILLKYNKIRDKEVWYPDCKSQVSVEYDNGKPVRIDSVVISAHHSDKLSNEIVHKFLKYVIEDTLKDYGYSIEEVNLYINPTGRFVIGGPNGDTGLTGRKIIVDTYGGYFRHGGGAFCLPEYQKIDTPDGGRIPIKDIKAGDEVYIETDSYTVLNKIGAEIKKAFRLTTASGYQIDSSSDHNFAVYSKKNGLIYKPLKDLRYDDYLLKSFTPNLNRGERHKFASLIGMFIRGGYLRDGKLYLTSLIEPSKSCFNYLSSLGVPFEPTFNLPNNALAIVEIGDCEFKDYVIDSGMLDARPEYRQLPPECHDYTVEDTLDFLTGFTMVEGIKIRNSEDGDRLVYLDLNRELAYEIQRMCWNILLFFNVKLMVIPNRNIMNGSYSLELPLDNDSVSINNKVDISVHQAFNNIISSHHDNIFIPYISEVLKNEYSSNPDFKDFILSRVGTDGKPIDNPAEWNNRTVISRSKIDMFLKEGSLSEPTKLQIQDAFMYYYDPVVRIEPVGDFQMYDIEVEEAHKFSIDGYIVHNSGKDPSKVDRSGAYMCRYIAKNLVASGIADKCEVQLSYAIGVASPVSVMVETFGTSKYSPEDLEKIVRTVFQLTPQGIITELELLSGKFSYADLARNGHFGRTDVDLPWERTDKVLDIKSVIRTLSHNI